MVEMSRSRTPEKKRPPPPVPAKQERLPVLNFTPSMKHEDSTRDSMNKSALEREGAVLMDIVKVFNTQEARDYMRDVMSDTREQAFAEFCTTAIEMCMEGVITDEQGDWLVTTLEALLYKHDDDEPLPVPREFLDVFERAHESAATAMNLQMPAAKGINIGVPAKKQKMTSWFLESLRASRVYRSGCSLLGVANVAAAATGNVMWLAEVSTLVGGAAAAFFMCTLATTVGGVRAYQTYSASKGHWELTKEMFKETFHEKEGASFIPAAISCFVLHYLTKFGVGHFASEGHEELQKLYTLNIRGWFDDFYDASAKLANGEMPSLFSIPTWVKWFSDKRAGLATLDNTRLRDRPTITGAGDDMFARIARCFLAPAVVANDTVSNAVDRRLTTDGSLPKNAFSRWLYRTLAPRLPVLVKAFGIPSVSPAVQDVLRLYGNVEATSWTEHGGLVWFSMVGKCGAMAQMRWTRTNADEFVNKRVKACFEIHDMLSDPKYQTKQDNSVTRLNKQCNVLKSMLMNDFLDYQDMQREINVLISAYEKGRTLTSKYGTNSDDDIKHAFDTAELAEINHMWREQVKEGKKEEKEDTWKWLKSKFAQLCDYYATSPVKGIGHFVVMLLQDQKSVLALADKLVTYLDPLDMGFISSVRRLNTAMTLFSYTDEKGEERIPYVQEAWTVCAWRKKVDATIKLHNDSVILIGVEDINDRLEELKTSIQNKQDTLVGECENRRIQADNKLENARQSSLNAERADYDTQQLRKAATQVAMASVKDAIKARNAADEECEEARRVRPQVVAAANTRIEALQRSLSAVANATTFFEGVKRELQQLKNVADTENILLKYKGDYTLGHSRKRGPDINAQDIQYDDDAQQLIDAVLAQQPVADDDGGAGLGLPPLAPQQ